jgi:uncharacterized membrane protein
MLSSWNKWARVALSGFVIALSIAYPLVVFALEARVPAIAFALAACGLLLLRTVHSPLPVDRPIRFSMIAAIVLIVGLAQVDSQVAAKAYPVVISGGLAFLFGASLRRPPSLVERMAELGGETLSPAIRLYCRRVTMVWALWLTINTFIAAALAVFGSLEAWALWTGLLSYLVMGLIFAAEFTLRRFVRRRHAAG